MHGFSQILLGKTSCTLEIALATVTDMSWMKGEPGVPSPALGVMFFLPAQPTAPGNARATTRLTDQRGVSFKSPLPVFRNYK